MTTGALLAAGAASVAAALLAGGGRSPGDPAARRQLRPTEPPGRRRALVVVGGVAVLGTAAGAGLEGRHLVLAGVVTVAAMGVIRLLERSAENRRAEQRRQRVIDYCEALVGELRAGQPVVRAVEQAATVWPEAAAASAAAQVGASVPAALQRLAVLPGAASVRRLAAAWQVSSSTGAGLAVAVEQVLATARAEDATTRLVRGELASARATARLVSALPVVVLLAAQGIGARPWHFLLDTMAGSTCLAAGVGLNLVGLAWIDRIAEASVEGGR